MRSVLLVIGLLLAMPAAAKEKPQVPAELAPTHGYVYVGFPKSGVDALIVSPLAGGQEFKIDTPATAAPLADAKAYGKWLPAGAYRIVGWGALKWEQGPQFEVQAGRVTDLGNFMGVNVGGYQLVLVPIPHPEHAGLVAAATQPFASLLKDATPLAFESSAVSPAMTLGQPATGLGLVADLLLAYDRKVNKPSTLQALKGAKTNDEFLRILRTMTPPLQDEPARLADGTLFFPADYGQVRKRAPDGVWSSVGMDTLRQILSVEQVDGRLVAGSDDGRLRESRDGGTTWAEMKALGSLQSILDIDHAQGAWVVTTTEKFDDADAPRGGGLVAAAKGSPSIRLRVYVGHSDDFSDLAPSKEFTLAPKDQVGWLGARGQLRDGRYYVLAGTALQRLDVASNQWKTITPGPRISSHRIDPKTGVLTALWSQGAFSKVHVSSDQGDSWTPIGRPPYIINDVQMDSASEGWASRWNMNAFSGVWETYTFVPGKNDWNKSGEAPFNCRLMRIAPDLPILCFAPDTSIFSLRDGKWEAEFSGQ